MLPRNRGLFLVGLAAVCLLTALFSVGCSPSASNRPDASFLTQRLDALIPACMRATGTPGVAVALIHGGEVVWSKGYGVADLSSGKPVTPDSVFGVASISKTATAWGVMKLVESGRVDLDAPVEDYLTRWRIPGDDSGQVTIRRLLSHSAGLNTPEYLGRLPGETLPRIEDVLTFGSGKAGGVRLERTPGSRFAYSDGGYLILQLLIEEVSGEDFSQYMQREILTPLGMSASSFQWRPDIQSQIVTSYSETGKPFPHYLFIEKAPAGLYTAAPDLAKLVAAGMKGSDGQPPGRGILQPATVEQMMTPAIEIRGFERLIYAQGYGLGYFIETLPDGRRLVSHMGGNLNGVTEFAAIPASGEGIVVLTTSIAGHELFADVLHAWTDWLGSGDVTLPRAIRFARRVLFSAATVFGLAAALILIRLAAALRRRKRIWGLPDNRLAWLRKTLAAGLSMAGVLLFVGVVYPYLHISMPSAALLFTANGVGLCLAALGWQFTKARLMS